MSKSAEELQAGEVIRLEYGTYDNFVNFILDEVSREGDSIKVKCHRGQINETFSFRPDECVEVTGNA